MYATLMPGFNLKLSTILAQYFQVTLANSPALPTKPAASGVLAKSSFEAEKKRCQLFAGKGPAIWTCIDQAKRNLERMRNAPPQKPMTELEKENARCDTLGKTAVVMNCKREAPARIAARRKAAAEAKPDSRTPLEKAVARCRLFHSKMPPTMECIREAKRNYTPAK